MGKEEVKSGYIKIGNNLKEIQELLFSEGYAWLKGDIVMDNKHNFKYIYFWDDGTMSYSNKKHPQPHIKERFFESRR